MALAALVAVALTAGCSNSGDETSPTTAEAASESTGSANATTTTTAVPSSTIELSALHAVRGDQPAIVDAEGRQVILRGVNVNSLGDYHQGDPEAATVVPVTDSDWADMAAEGFNVVRLLVSWSKLEPERGRFDEAYLDQVADAVDAAAAHGIYTVIDMHQDAWGRYIASPTGVTCPEGSEPSIGWDGAPQWATLTDGASTCNYGSRESAPAVQAAWDSFYANRETIMDELVATWSFVAERFADVEAVAGYDLLNEPNNGTDQAASIAALGTFYDRAIGAIRSAEAGGEISHIAFFETTVSGLPVADDFTDDTNIVFAPHNYGESIGPLPIEGTFDYFATLAARYGTALWVGEYGFFEDSDEAEEKLGRYVAKEDALITAGAAWWQWRQACGDPHSVGRPGGKSAPVQIHLRTNGCPGDVDGGVNPRWACLGRSYPRAAPGRLTELTANCAGTMSLRGTAPEGLQEIVVWTPGNSGDPIVAGDQLSDVRTQSVDGGYVITAAVQGEYSMSISPAP